VLAGAVHEVQGDDVRLPRIYMGFHAPRFGDDRWYAADLLTNVLTDGKSSVLYEDLVYRRRLAQDVGCYVFPTELSATFVVISTAKPDTDPEELEAALVEHLRRAAAEPFEDKHLMRARHRLLTSHYGQLQTLERRADLLSLFTTYFDDPHLVGESVGRYERLEADDLQAFAGEYLRPDRRAVVTVVPREQG
jgi:predicted Zn-dependent peptidase